MSSIEGRELLNSSGMNLVSWNSATPIGLGKHIVFVLAYQKPDSWVVLLCFQYVIYCRHVGAELPDVAGSECTRLDFYNTIGVQFYIIKQ